MFNKNITTTLSEQTKAFSDILNAQVSFAKKVFESQQTILNKASQGFSKVESFNTPKSIEDFSSFVSEHQQEYLDAVKQVQDAILAWNDLSWQHTESFIEQQVSTLKKTGQKEAAVLVEQIQDNLVQGRNQVEAGKKAVDAVVAKVLTPRKTTAKK